MIKEGTLEENEPFYEDFEETVKDMIEDSCLVEYYEMDPETGRYVRRLKFTELGKREAEKSEYR